MNRLIFNCKLLFALLFIYVSIPLSAKVLEPESNFGIIGRIIAAVLASEHYVYIDDDEKLSKELFNEYLKALDPSHLYFTQKDVDSFEESYEHPYYQLKQGDTSFAFAAYNKLVEKVRQRNDFAKKLIDKGFDFSVSEDYEFDRSKSPWAKDENELDNIWRKKIKNDLLTFKLSGKIAKSEKANEKNPASKASDTRVDSQADSKENNAVVNDILRQKTPEQRLLSRMRTHRIYLEDNDAINVLELYLSALARLYDPHSSYMSPKTEDDFNIHMQLSFVGIGALLSGEDGYTKVEKIFPGGPADKCKLLKAADRIIAVREEGKDPVDVIDVPLTKVVEKIRGPKGTKVYLTILKGEEGLSAIPKEISIVRDTVEMKEAEASSEIKEITDANGIKHKFGIVVLPSFYMDFQSAQEGKKDFKSSAEDVKKILEDFNKNHVDGVVFDLRGNGGGSLKEAIELTGLFIKSGPVVQTRNTRGDVSVEEDSYDSPVYTGPLIVLVNKLSASASEIFAGAIQDYGRGIIVGDKSTHGKGTVQSVVELSKVLSRFNVGFNPGAIKLTNAKFYRVTGSSTQNKGVSSDVAFNSLTDYMDLGEDSLENALPWDSITQTQFEKEGNIKDTVDSLRENSMKRRANNKYFQQFNKLISLFKEYKDKKKVSLNEQTRWDEYLKEKNLMEDQKNFIASMEPDQTETVKSQDPESKEGVNEEKNDTDKDFFMIETLNILGDYVDILQHKIGTANKLASAEKPKIDQNSKP